MTTIRQLVDRVHTSAIAIGMDLSPKDVAFIISQFLVGMAASDPLSPADDVLRSIADEVDGVTDE